MQSCLSKITSVRERDLDLAQKYFTMLYVNEEVCLCACVCVCVCVCAYTSVCTVSDTHTPVLSSGVSEVSNGGWQTVHTR